MTRSTRPPVVAVLRFAEELATLCNRYSVEAWFVPHASIRRIHLVDLPHLPKSMIRGGSFAVALVKDSLYRGAGGTWYVSVGDMAGLGRNLEAELVARVLQYTFESGNLT